MIIESIDNKKIKEIKRIYKNQSSISDFYIVEGEHLVTEAYKAGVLEEIIMLEDTINNYSIPVTLVTEKVMKNISNMKSFPKEIGICKKTIKDIESKKILVCDDVQDPANLGALIRSAVAFNVDTIVLSSGCVSEYNHKVLRAAQGMSFYVNIIREDLYEYINLLKTRGFTIYSTDINEGINVKNIKKVNKYALILGNEGSGVSKELLDLSNINVYIDTNSMCESLNVAIAGSIILYELEG